MAPSPQALVAHVLRRLTFGPSPDRVREFVDNGGPQAAIDWALNAEPRAILPTAVTKDDWDPNLRGWTDNMRSLESGLHEKMTWFWHNHFATSSAKVGNPPLLHAQQAVLRTHAMGNFQAFLREMTTNAAMLLYLDGSGSSVAAPNENFGREVMELFSIGRGNYSEQDVKASALAFAGWEADYETGAVKLNSENALGGEIEFLGRRGRLSVDDAIDVLCHHEACAPFIVAKMYRFLVGVEPTKERLTTLAAGFAKDLEIRPLVTAIVTGPEFLEFRMNRPRYAIEWWVSALHALGEFREGEDADVNPWILERLGQLPHLPPNVGGWPEGDSWLGPSQQLGRTSYIWGLSWRMEPIEASGTDLVAGTLRRAGLHEVSKATMAAMRKAAIATAGAADALSVSRRLITVATSSPEFGLA
jgi:uncharacterized protein (DUF1800 family)